MGTFLVQINCFGFACGALELKYDLSGFHILAADSDWQLWICVDQSEKYHHGQWFPTFFFACVQDKPA